MTRQRADQVAAAIQQQLQARVDVEQVGNGRFRFGVVAAQFQGMAHHQRQDRLWAIVDTVLQRPETLDVSMIIALAPSEAA